MAMNKRSAMFVAAGLVLSLLVAGVAMSMGVTGPSADAKTVARSQKPIVKTTTRTVTIHKQAKGEAAAGAVIVRTTDPAGGTVAESGDDDQYESEGMDDESEDQESEDQESEDQESEDHSSEDPSTEDHASESDDD
jgi:cobalamin biosynthesis protein CobT